MKTICTFLTLFILPFLLFAQGEKGVVPVTSIVPSTAPSTRAVVIGISDYQNLPDLKFADRDAVAFADFLQSPAGGSVPPENIRLLTNKEATAGAVGMELWWLLQESKAGDQAIIYFSGHGDMEAQLVDQLGFLLCWDSQSFAYFSGGAIQVTTLQSIVNTLAQLNKARVLLITDACRAGKLAGSAINGAGATAANLKNFANAAKILSCQPTEFSLEGEEWGGGRGAFSYHLIDGLYGLADNDKDLQVKLKEIGRYLEDHVPAETAPHQQNPLVDGDRETLITRVDPQMLAQWEARKKQEQPVFSSGDIRGMEHLVFTQADTGIQEVYAAYTAAVKAGNLMSPAGSSANDYYEILIHEPHIQAMHGMLTRNFVAALIDESQQVTNKLLKTDPQTVSYVWYRPVIYDHIPAYLERATELLGESHFFYNNLKAKQYFFEGKTCRQYNQPDISPDSLARFCAALMEKALRFDSNTTYVYVDLGFLYFFSLTQKDKALKCALKAIELSPNWVYAHFLAGHFPGQVEKHQLKALELDSTFLLPYQILSQNETGNHSIYRNQFIQKVQARIAADSANVPPYYRSLLGAELWRSGRLEEAEKELLIAERLTNGLDLAVYQYLGVTWADLGQYDKALEAAKKQIELGPYNPNGYAEMHRCYKSMNQVEKAIAALESAFAVPGNANNALFNSPGLHLTLGEDYQAVGRKQEAKEQFQKALELLPGPRNKWEILYIGRAYLGLGNLTAMQRMIEDALQRWPDDPWIYYLAACLYALAKDEPKALEWLERTLKTALLTYSQYFSDTDLDNIRNSEGFKALMRQYFPEETKE